MNDCQGKRIFSGGNKWPSFEGIIQRNNLERRKSQEINKIVRNAKDNRLRCYRRCSVRLLQSYRQAWMVDRKGQIKQMLKLNCNARHLMNCCILLVVLWTLIYALVAVDLHWTRSDGPLAFESDKLAIIHSISQVGNSSENCLKRSRNHFSGLRSPDFFDFIGTFALSYQIVSHNLTGSTRYVHFQSQRAFEMAIHLSRRCIQNG